jgi:3'-phosphoadenosine 5'-phosphosulfate sulfotransferase (PAPS reductase)/FAD synthetase
MMTTGISSDWQYEYIDDRFKLTIQPATNFRNFRDACVHRAKELAESLTNPVMSLSGGLDSQIVLHSFYEQGIKLDCIFRHFPGYNDNELANILSLQKKYGFKFTKLIINPDECKEEILEEFRSTRLQPNQLLYKKFYAMFPDDLDIIQGLDGPNIYSSPDKKLYYFESYNSFEFVRRRAVDLLNRRGKFISFEKNSNVLLSIFNEELMDHFLHTYDYFFHNQVEGVKIIDMWDVYLKTFIYYKHWKHELEYFPKYQGLEGIDWIINGPKHDYAKKIIHIETGLLINHLSTGQMPITFTSN